MIKKIVYSAVLSSHFLPISTVFGQEVTPDVVVTANRIETPPSQLGSAVTVMTAADIARQQAQTVPDLLRMAPGLSVTSNGGLGQTTTVRIRGAEGYHTKVLIDGVDMADQSTPQTLYDFGQLQTADIDRIEIVRGSQSLLYGSDAIGGVINIITKQGKGAPQGHVQAEVGSRGTYKALGHVSGEDNGVRYALNISRLASDGISAADERAGNTERDGMWSNAASGSLGLRLTPSWGVKATARYSRSRVDYDGQDFFSSPTRAVDDVDYNIKTEGMLKIGTDFSFFDGRWKNDLSVSRTAIRRQSYGGENATNSIYHYDSDVSTLSWLSSVTVAKNQTAVFGADYTHDTTQQEGISKSVSNQAGFVDYQFNPFEPLFLTAGVRLDNHRAFGSHLTWRTTAAYLVDYTNTRLHSSYGTGFRAPSLYELFSPFGGSQQLDPETSRSWDVGVEQTFLEGRAVIDITGFQTRFQDKIGYEYPRGYYNITGHSTAQGVEVTAHWDVIETVRLTGGYTFTDTENRETGKPLPLRPRHQGSFGIGWQAFENFTADFTLRASGAQYDSTKIRLGGYATADIAVAYDIKPEFRVFARLENITDKHYQQVYSYGVPGRTVYAGVRVGF